MGLECAQKELMSRSVWASRSGRSGARIRWSRQRDVSTYLLVAQQIGHNSGGDVRENFKRVGEGEVLRGQFGGSKTKSLVCVGNGRSPDPRTHNHKRVASEMAQMPA